MSFVVGGPVGDFELLLCHGTVCVVGKMRDLILQLSKSSIYSTKPVRQRGFVIATGTVIRQVTLQNEFNSAQPLSTDASMRIINDKYIAKIDDAEVQNSVRKTFRINGLTSRQLSWWTFIIVAIMAIINIIFYASNIFDFY